MDTRADYLTVLELDSEATPTQIREAYLDLVKVWHPDRFADDSRLRRKAQNKLKQITASYRYLMGHHLPASRSGPFTAPEAVERPSGRDPRAASRGENSFRVAPGGRRAPSRPRVSRQAQRRGSRTRSRSLLASHWQRFAWSAVAVVVIGLALPAARWYWRSEPTAGVPSDRFAALPAPEGRLEPVGSTEGPADEVEPAVKLARDPRLEEPAQALEEGSVPVDNGGPSDRHNGSGRTDQIRQAPFAAERDVAAAVAAIPGTGPAGPKGSRSAPPPAREHGISFTLGSKHELVRLVQGAPDQIHRVEGLAYMEWRYGQSTVQISKGGGRVVAWKNAGNLKVALNPHQSVGGGAAFFGQGSGWEDVTRVQGTPSEIHNYSDLELVEWRYGRSTVQFSSHTGKVLSWRNAGDLRINLLPVDDASRSAAAGRRDRAGELAQFRVTPEQISRYLGAGPILREDAEGEGIIKVWPESTKGWFQQRELGLELDAAAKSPGSAVPVSRDMTCTIQPC